MARDWRGNGIARAILSRRISLMRATGASLSMSVATNPLTQHLLGCDGFEVVAEMKLGEFIESDDTEWKAEDKHPNSVKLMVLRLKSTNDN